MNTELFHKVLSSSFSAPHSFPSVVDLEITRNRSLNSKDRREFSDLIYDAIRWRRRIWGDISPSHFNWDSMLKKLDEAKTLRIAPPLAKWSTLSTDALAREVSFPTWIVERWIHSLGFSATVSLALSLNESAPVTLRVNTLKKDRTSLRKILEDEDIPTAEGKLSPWALHVLNRQNLRSLKSFKAGWFDIQDEGSQLTLLATDAKAEQKTLDVGTGAGGKALGFGMMMENRGLIVGADSDARKESEFRERMKRAGVKIAEFKWVAQDDPHPLSNLEASADIVFVDAPCSALGTLRRKPWAKWEINPSMIDSLPAKQWTLLKRFASLVRPGGKLFYVTCTIHSLENEEVANGFLRDNQAFTPSSPMRTLRPDIEGTDGFFVASFQRQK